MKWPCLLLQGDWNAASDGRWKLYRPNTGGIRFYNLLSDPAEVNDLSEKFRPDASKLLAAVNELPEFGSGKKARNIPEDLVELLKSLGYVHK